MNTRATRKVETDETPGSTETATSFFADSLRRQLTLSSEVVGALQRGAAAVQEVQQQVMRQSTEKFQNAVREPGVDFSPSSILAAQTRYWSIDQDLVRDYWRDMTAAFLQMQSDLASCTTGILKEPSDSPLKAMTEFWQGLLARSFYADTNTAS